LIQFNFSELVEQLIITIIAMNPEVFSHLELMYNNLDGIKPIDTKSISGSSDSTLSTPLIKKEWYDEPLISL